MSVNQTGEQASSLSRTVGILPAGPANPIDVPTVWHALCRFVSAIAFGFLISSCSHAAPLLKLETQRGPIQYSLHSPKTPPRHRVILAHGFLRSPDTMGHLAEFLAEGGIETACIQLKRSTPLNGNHAENARDMIALREALGWKKLTYAGFSAGGLSALLAASQDSACEALLLLDPVDHGTLGKDAAPKLRIPTLAVLGKPGPGNANRNCTAMLAALAGCKIVEIPTATHCDFEAKPSTLCYQLTGSQPDPVRTAEAHKVLSLKSSAFLKNIKTDAP